MKLVKDGYLLKIYYHQAFQSYLVGLINYLKS